MGKCHFTLSKGYANEIDYNSASIGSFFFLILSPT